MIQERSAHDKIHLLMEETGCDPWQAELAIKSADYDVEKAIRTIGTLLRNIVVVKAKFRLTDRHVYGLSLLIADLKRDVFLRIRCVVSRNPALYETPLDGEWYDFEKSLYVFRLSEGALQKTTQDLEKVLSDALNREGESSFFSGLRDGQDESIRTSVNGTMRAFFSEAAFESSFLRQVLNLNQYRRLIPADEPAAGVAGPDSLADPGGRLIVEVSPELDEEGIPADELRPGDTVSIRVTDERDVARYLAKLVGGLDKDEPRPVSAPVEEVQSESGDVIIQVRLASAVTGLSRVAKDRKLKADRPAGSSWWRRWIPSL